MRLALQGAGTGLRHASLANALQLGETMVATNGATLGRAIFPASTRSATLSG